MKKGSIKDMVEETVEEIANVQVNQIPISTDPNWVEYVLDQLSNHELANGSPTTDGLRRVTEKIFGEIIESDTEILEFPAQNFGGKATAKHTLVISKYSGETIKVSACVDVLGEKLPYPFNQHLVSTACTRAEGKALRRALKIRVQTAEELANSDEQETLIDEPINDQQIVAIKTLCKRNNINLVAFIKNNCNNVKTINEVKNVEGRLLINKLSSYQREPIPSNILGYNQNWETEFGGK